MAVESISSLFSENPITTLTDDYMFEVAGDAGVGVVSGATKLATIKSNVLAAPIVTGAATVVDLNLGSSGGGLLTFRGPGTFPTADLADATGLRLRTAITILGNYGIDFSQSSILLWPGGVIPFGQATASYPGLKRNVTQLKCRLGDDSGDAPFSASIFTGSGSGLTSVPGSLTIDSGWLGNADGGDKTKVIPSSGTISGIGTALDIISAGAGTAFVQVAEKVKAIETALVSLLAPNN